jgi:hypothetical protein
VWAINPPAYARLAPLRKTVGIPFLLLGATLAVAAIKQMKIGLYEQVMVNWKTVVHIKELHKINNP